MSTVAIISCADTKLPEMIYLQNEIHRYGCKTLIIDTSTKESVESQFISLYPRDVIAAASLYWDDFLTLTKHEKIQAMCEGISALVSQLYKEGRIHAAISIGGLQNTIIGCSGLRSLPIGVPKFMISTVATGTRTFDFITGTKDVTVMPSISDFAGLNSISKTILSNAAAGIVGMTLHSGPALAPSQTVVIGTTLMGATNDGVVNAAAHLQQMGYEVISFHSTGIGGKTMEELISSGFINAAMDLTLHEIVYEYFGSGFGYGANNRLLNGAQAGIPMVICPAGIDFICLQKGATFPDLEKRNYIWHNANLAHVKLLPHEVLDICHIIISRLNQAAGPIEVVFPLQGTRSFTKVGEPLHDSALDQMILHTFQTELRSDIPFKTIDCNFMDMEFSLLAANSMHSLICESLHGGNTDGKD